MSIRIPLEYQPEDSNDGAFRHVGGASVSGRLLLPLLVEVSKTDLENWCDPKTDLELALVRAAEVAGVFVPCGA